MITTDKRYQVFVSSTYDDLQDERKEVMQALLELDCIPAGMELFPASSEDQWSLIKRVIDDCDYYFFMLIKCLMLVRMVYVNRDFCLFLIGLFNLLALVLSFLAYVNYCFLLAGILQRLVRWRLLGVQSFPC